MNGTTCAMNSGTVNLSSFQVTYFLIGILLFILAIIGVAVYYLLRPYERRIYKLANVPSRDFGEESPTVAPAAAGPMQSAI